VADEVLCSLDGLETAPADIWTADLERHFMLVAARNLLPPSSSKRRRPSPSTRPCTPSSGRAGTSSSIGQTTCLCSTSTFTGSHARGLRAHRAEASPSGTRATRPTTGAGRASTARSSSQTCRLKRYTSSSTQSRLRFSRAIQTSRALCRRARRRRGRTTRNGAGGRNGPSKAQAWLRPTDARNVPLFARARSLGDIRQKARPKGVLPFERRMARPSRVMLAKVRCSRAMKAGSCSMPLKCRAASSSTSRSSKWRASRRFAMCSRSRSISRLRCRSTRMVPLPGDESAPARLTPRSRQQGQGAFWNRRPVDRC
jgi:hypothetical protein